VSATEPPIRVRSATTPWLAGGIRAKNSIGDRWAHWERYRNRSAVSTATVNQPRDGTDHVLSTIVHHVSPPASGSNTRCTCRHSSDILIARGSRDRRPASPSGARGNSVRYESSRANGPGQSPGFSEFRSPDGGFAEGGGDLPLRRRDTSTAAPIAARTITPAMIS
jgi:hypothetical protein